MSNTAFRAPLMECKGGCGHTVSDRIILCTTCYRRLPQELQEAFLMAQQRKAYEHALSLPSFVYVLGECVKYLDRRRNFEKKQGRLL